MIMHSQSQKKECITKDSDNLMESDYTNAWHLFLDFQIWAPFNVSIESAKNLCTFF